MKYVINRSPYAAEHRILTSNVLKIIAAITMVLDHVGVYLVGQSEDVLYSILRYAGRLSFPLFAYCVAEGCRYTRNKKKRFWTIFLMGIGFEIFWVCFKFISSGGMSLLDMFAGNPLGLIKFVRNTCVEGNVFLTFSCSILLIFVMQACKEGLAKSNWKKAVLYGGLFLVTCVGVYGFNYVMNGLSYGIYGILLPVLVASVDYDEDKAPKIFKKLDLPQVKMALFALGLILIALHSAMRNIQFLGLLAIIPLSLYNGKPGSGKMKWWFYVFYPAHLVLLWVIGQLIK